MKFYIAVTDNQWYKFLYERQPDELNFWRPGGKVSFRAIPQGSPFLFKLHSPLNYIVGGGFFLKYDAFPMSLVWEIFEEKNGAPDFYLFSKMIQEHRQDNILDPMIGCIILTEPFFFERGDWIPVPKNFNPSIQQGKTYDTDEYYGNKLWIDVKERMYSYKRVSSEILVSGNVCETAKYLVNKRLNQGSFRVLGVL